MNALRSWWAALTAGILSILIALPGVGAPDPKGRIAETIKAEVASLVAGINAHDVDRATHFDADDIISMESGRLPSAGLAAEKKGLAQAFQFSPSWKLALIDESVEVADSGELAVYRSTYDEDSVTQGVPMTHRLNFIAEFKRQADGTYKAVWSVVCAMEKSHPR